MPLVYPLGFGLMALHADKRKPDLGEHPARDKEGKIGHSGEFHLEISLNNCLTMSKPRIKYNLSSNFFNIPGASPTSQPHSATVPQPKTAHPEFRAIVIPISAILSPNLGIF